MTVLAVLAEDCTVRTLTETLSSLWIWCCGHIPLQLCCDAADTLLEVGIQRCWGLRIGDYTAFISLYIGSRARWPSGRVQRVQDYIILYLHWALHMTGLQWWQLNSLAGCLAFLRVYQINVRNNQHDMILSQPPHAARPCCCCAPPGGAGERTQDWSR